MSDVLQSWCVQWNKATEVKPQIIPPTSAATKWARNSSIYENAAGDFVAFDGYLFERDNLENIANESNAQLVASAYARWGNGFLDHLRGGFAFALWDSKRNELTIGRDAMGLNTCFYYHDGHMLIVSPSIDALLSHQQVGGHFNPIIVAEYIQKRRPLQQIHETFYQNIKRLPPAHLLTFDKRGLTISRYWDPIPPGFGWANDDEIDGFTSVFERAVSRCLSVGADSLALSGGFDSVSIAAVAAAQLDNKSPLHAVSLRFANTVVDEGHTQSAVAQTLNMPQFIQTLDESLAGENPVDAALALSAASPSPVLSVWQSMYSGLLRSASELDLYRLVMGTGGDEMFNVDFSYGTDLFAAMKFNELWRFYRVWQRSSPFSALRIARFVYWHYALKPVLRRLVVATLSKFASPNGTYTLRRTLRSVWPHWIAQANVDLLAALEGRRKDSPAIPLTSGEGSYVRTIRQLPQSPLLLMELDQGFAWAKNHGFTLLLPFFDRDLMELSLRMHPRHLVSGGWAKSPLRRLVANRIPSISMPSKKVDFTMMLHQILRSHGQAAWKKIGGPTMLSELGIVNPDGVNALMQDYFSERNDQWQTTWLILSTEAWLQARQQLMNAKG